LTLSPSIWWDDGILLDYEAETRQSNSSDSTFVFIGCGEFEEGIVILAQEWYYRLSTNYPDSKVEYYKLSNLSHVSSAMQNVSFGLELYYQTK
jgi:predicted alpha/beta superfamily hydrolase